MKKTLIFFLGVLLSVGSVAQTDSTRYVMQNNSVVVYGGQRVHFYEDVVPSYPAILDSDSVREWNIAAAEYITDEGGGEISQWDDISGYDNHLIEVTVSQRPTLIGDTVSFDGNDEIGFSFASAMPQPFTQFMLVKIESWTTFHRVSQLDGSAYFGQYLATPRMRINAGADVTSAAGTPSLNEWHVITLVYNGANSSIQIDDGTPVTGNAGANTIRQMEFGNQQVIMKLRENIVFSDVVTSENQTEVINYLDAKK